MSAKRIIVGSTGASGAPLLIEVLKLLQKTENVFSVLLLTEGAELTIRHETGFSPDEVRALADESFPINDIGAPPASGSYETAGMVIVPCSMKTLAGIHSGYAENLLLRAADVTLKEKRPLILSPRETPLSPIHLRNMRELSMLPTVQLIPPMLTYYHKPETIDEMTYHIAAKLVAPFGIEAPEYRRWDGL